MSADGVWLQLAWDEPQRISRVQLTFDTGFHRELTLTSSDSINKGIIRGPQPETVRDYQLQYRSTANGQWQPLVEVQTDKTTVEIPSPRAGTVLKILVEEGDVAPVGAVIVVIGEAGEQLLRALDGGNQAKEPASEPLVAVVPADPEAAVRATPAVRQLAKGLGVQLVGLAGSGPGGRIVEEDVRAAATEAATTQDGRRIPVRGIRRAIVEQVTRTHREVPAVTFVEECDFTGVDLSLLVPALVPGPMAAAASAWRRERPTPELQALMRSNDAAVRTAGNHLSDGNYDAIAADAAALGRNFATLEQFWRARQVEDAASLSRRAFAAAAELRVAALRGDAARMAEAIAAMTAVCNACHAQYREELPDQTYAIKL